MQTDAGRRAKAKYDSNNTAKFGFKLNLKTDKDIIDKLNSIDNKQGYIKELIRRDITPKRPD